MLTKVCNKCKEEKEVSFFTKNKNSKDGLYHYCSICNIARTRKISQVSRENNKCSNCKEEKMLTSRFCLYHWVRHILKNSSSNSYIFESENDLEKLTHLLIAKLKKQEFSCFYSDLELLPGFNASLDHRIPKSKGGTNDINNLIWVHKGINSMKCNSSEKGFLRNHAKTLVKLHTIGAI